MQTVERTFVRMKMANGTNPQGGTGPDSRMGAAYQQRQMFLKAQLEAKKRGLLTEDEPSETSRKKKKDTPKETQAYDPDYAMDPLLEILTGTVSSTFTPIARTIL